MLWPVVLSMYRLYGPNSVLVHLVLIMCWPVLDIYNAMSCVTLVVNLCVFLRNLNVLEDSNYSGYLVGYHSAFCIIVLADCLCMSNNTLGFIWLLAYLVIHALNYHWINRIGRHHHISSPYFRKEVTILTKGIKKGSHYTLQSYWFNNHFIHGIRNARNSLDHIVLLDMINI